MPIPFLLISCSTSFFLTFTFFLSFLRSWKFVWGRVSGSLTLLSLSPHSLPLSPFFVSFPFFYSSIISPALTPSLCPSSTLPSLLAVSVPLSLSFSGPPSFSFLLLSPPFSSPPFPTNSFSPPSPHSSSFSLLLSPLFLPFSSTTSSNFSFLLLPHPFPSTLSLFSYRGSPSLSFFSLLLPSPPPMCPPSLSISL